MADPTAISYHLLSDEELVQRYRKNFDEAIFQELSSRYRFQVLGRCLQITRHPEDAEDICQSVFTDLLEWMKSEQKIVSIPSKLFTTATYRSLDFIRRKERYREILQEFSRKSQESHLDFMENGDSIRFILEQEEKAEVLRQEIETLPSVQRDCIERFYFGKYSYQEIADELARPLSQVKSALQNGKRRLRGLLKDL